MSNSEHSQFQTQIIDGRLYEVLPDGWFHFVKVVRPEPEPTAIEPGKSFFDLNLEELQALAQQAVKNAVAEMHAKGIPSIKAVSNEMYKEYPNGDLQWLKTRKKDEKLIEQE